MYSENPYDVEIGRFISDIHFIWRPANWPDRPKRALRAFHGFGEYLVGFYGFNARRQSRWFVHRTFIFRGRQSCGLTDGSLFSCQIFMVVCHVTALYPPSLFQRFRLLLLSEIREIRELDI